MSGSQFDAVFQLPGRIAGSILGSPYQQYRPNGANNPTSDDNLLATIRAWITADAKGKALRPATYAKPTWYSLHDPALTQVGDYLIGPLGTYFISSQDYPHPFQVVVCNHTVTISEAGTITGTGIDDDYGGDQRATENIIATNWPCSMLQGTKGEIGSSKLPGDAKQPWTAVLMPAIPGVTLRNDMIITDEISQRHIMSSVELSNLGYRMTAMLATT